ncbi:MAG: di-trans,poly-cis-decaprenylcistransferase [Clostridia bacterium]|nr:di-trans,poly-cis-decaprenylcistransferase [Clostridia bacterium]
MEKDLKKLPKHIAFIIDGNGRWAKKRGLSRSMGHKAGFNRLEKTIKECFYGYGIPIVSIYAFSTENWNRPQDEVDYLVEIFRKYVGNSFAKKYPEVRLNIMGDYTKFPQDVAESARKTMEQTKDNTKFILNLGINYSGQDELVYAVNNILAEGIQNVDRQTIEDHLYTKGQPPVDFCVRTSGEYRISNFMLWQLAYAEFYFPKVCWPGYTSKHLYASLLEFQNRDRRFGAIKE